MLENVNIETHPDEQDGVDLYTDAWPASLTPFEARRLAEMLMQAAQEVENGVPRIS